MHAFYVAGGGFRWCLPKIDLLNAAGRVTGACLNRYPHNVIGAAVYVCGRGIGLRWRAS